MYIWINEWKIGETPYWKYPTQKRAKVVKRIEVENGAVIIRAITL
jgi:hypothetical protein